MFQQRAESEDQAELMYTLNNILEEPIHQRPSNLGGSAHQSQLIYTSNSSLEESIHQLHSNLGGSAHQSDQFFPGSDVCYTVFGWFNRLLWKAITQLAPSSNQGGSAHQPQLSEAQFLANDIWRGLVQPNVNPGGWLSPTQSLGVQPNVNPGQSVQQDVNRGGRLSPTQSLGVQPNVNPGQSVPQDVNPGGRLSPTQSEDQFDIPDGGVQPNVNPGGSAHHPQLTETQSAPNEIGTAEHLKYYRSLHYAAKRGDWESAKSFIEKDPNALAARITVDSKTVLHVAALCDQWEFILKLLELVSSPESIAVKDKKGRTVLHYVAQAGSLKTAKALVQKNVGLLQIGDNKKHPPLLHSIWSESKELVRYLSLRTSLDLSLDSTWVFRTLIKSGYHDIALYFVRRYPNLVLAEYDHGESLLYWLATNPYNFLSSSNLGLIERWIYKCVEIKYPSTHSESVIINMKDSTEGFPALQSRSLANRVLQWFKRLLWKAIIVQLAPSVNMVRVIRDTKLKHICAVKLVNLVCTQLQNSNKSFQEIEHFLKKPNSLDSAIKNGIKEIVSTLLQEFPDLINVQVLENRNILQTAVQYRQENIVNVIKEISTTTTKDLGSRKIAEECGVTLHLAGELAPPFKLLSVSGAALRMQRELQWFKEVEEITFTYRREWKDENDKTPKEVFREEHEKLAKEGQEWMKATANSCMLVSTLIATVLFAAAFTVPGGNGNDNGIAIFLRKKAFMTFAISDAIGLFSSLTSVLMFLAIQTERYELDDFLKSLPRKLIIGLGSLFIAIAAMMIAFGATLTIVLSERWYWVSMLINLVAFVPVVMFATLQLPLFIEMVWSTCGASIFRPWPSKNFE